MHRTIASLLACALVLAATPAQAQQDETTADVRCVLVGVKIAQQPDPGQQNIGTLLAMYYIGRIEGRLPKLDIEELMITELGRMKPADYNSEAARCGSHLTEKGQEISRIGKDIVERASKKP